MKITYHPASGLAAKLALSLCFALAFSSPVAGVGFTFRLLLGTSNQSYRFSASLSTNSITPDAPAGTYFLYSPQQPTNGGWSGYMLTTDNSWSTITNSYPALYSDLASVMQQITNGSWRVVVTNDTSTNTYTFAVSAPGFSSSALPLTIVTFPTNGATQVTNQPTFTWTGPVNWPVSSIAEAYQPTTSFFQYSFLPASQTNWTIPVFIPSGIDTTFYVGANTNYVTSLFIATTPLNINNAQQLAGWTTTTTLSSSGSISFRTVSPPAPPTSHTLVLRCDFENTNAYSQGSDSSGNFNSANGFTTWGSPNTVDIADPNAKVGSYARRFYGASSIDWLSSANISNALTGSFSVCAWVKTTNSAGMSNSDARFGAVLFADYNYDYGSNTNDFIPLALTGGNVAFLTRDAAGNPSTLHSTNTVNDGNYHLIAVTRDQTTGLKSVYVDGQLAGTETGPTQAFGINDNDVTIGGSYVYSDSFSGLVDDFQLYTGVLNPSEVAYVYAHPGSTAPYIGLTVPLGDALNATNLTWTTSGDANWIGQTTVSHDGVSSAMSGVITNLQTNTLQTTVTGPGTLVYWWQNPATNASFNLAFNLDGVNITNLAARQSWVKGGPFTIGAGAHTLAWVASAGGSLDTNNAAYVDQVHFAPAVDISGFQLSIVLGFDLWLGQYFEAYPWLSSTNPPVVTYDIVESPNKLFTARAGMPPFPVLMTNLDSIINECTNGSWTITINKGSTNQQIYTFSVSMSGVTTNLLSPVSVLSPTNGSTGVSTQPLLSWSGPAGLPSITAHVYSDTNMDIGALITLTNSATVINWPSPPVLPLGTNDLYVGYYTVNFPGVTFTTPVDSFQVPVRTWNTSSLLESTAMSGFVVSSSTAQPVRLLNPTVSGTTFAFSFQTQTGRSHTLQARTNVASGNWTDLTNFAGDGSIRQFTFPTTNPPARVFRVRTN